MKKFYTQIALVISFLLIGTSIASASIPASQQGRDHSPVITENGELVRVDFIHYAKDKNPARPDKPGGGGSKKPKETVCYDLMGVKWKQNNLSYYVNPTNSGMTTTDVMSAFNTSFNTWDNETAYNLFGAANVDTNAVYGDQNYKNEIAFGLYNDPGVIAVTTTWYTRRGKEIVEFDMLYNTSFNWGDGAANSSLMDLQSIATHELGHGIGLLDIYTDTCSEVTMFGYGSEGETKARDLEPADITGLESMYGI